MSEALKVACASLKIQSGQCTIVPNYKCKAEQSELVKSIETLFHNDAIIVVWQMQSILWGRFKNGRIIWADEKDVFEEGWLELRVFNGMEELHLRRKGSELVGRYRSDNGEEACEYVDSFSRFWGENTTKDIKTEAGFVRLQDDQRKLKLNIPVSDTTSKWYGLLTRNYVTTNDVNGQAGYTDYRFVDIASADLEGA